jgi:hypothetical protein
VADPAVSAFRLLGLDALLHVMPERGADGPLLTRADLAELIAQVAGDEEVHEDGVRDVRDVVVWGHKRTVAGIGSLLSTYLFQGATLCKNGNVPD